jgi:uncharacterized protein YlzI (FlbEa/FlbD family)
MNFMRVTLYDQPEGGTKYGWVNIDSIQMILCPTSRHVAPPTTLVLVGREVRVKESIEEIAQSIEDVKSDLEYQRRGEGVLQRLKEVEDGCHQ